ncbi:hypothetical protein [Guptibacillus spartinae]|uniref:hypothetical protein n=1 Tax=Guptibacillus spartinae TaxID=3025679 RepID=UPI0023601A7D|nr:hypothetical protein [Pseudalkalibacillus spartinae]
MYTLLWMVIIFSTIGLMILVSLKKRMESKLAFIRAAGETEESARASRSIILWIWSAVAWGIVSMSLISWWFNHYFG